jgi:hypothetical protein
VSNTDNVNILCKYIMYLLTDYILILTKDTKDRPDLSSDRADPRGTALAMAISNSKLQNKLQNNKPQLRVFKRTSQGE